GRLKASALEQSHDVHPPWLPARRCRETLRDRQPVLVRQLACQLHAVASHERVVRRDRDATSHLRPYLEHLAMESPPRDDVDGQELSTFAVGLPGEDLQFVTGRHLVVQGRKRYEL